MKNEITLTYKDAVNSHEYEVKKQSKGKLLVLGASNKVLWNEFYKKNEGEII